MNDSDSIFTEQDNQNINGGGEMHWSEEHEDILIDWADKAMCYRWLHARANQQFAKLARWFTIPVIIISTVTGTANFAQDRVPVEYVHFFVMVVGTLNIIAGIISTVQQFLKINELNESHRVSSIAWAKFYRNIKVELAKNPKERIPITQMLKYCKEEFDRLMETSPSINEKVIKKFNKTFKNSDTFNMIKKPEICDALVSTETFKFTKKTDDTAAKFQNIKFPVKELLRRKREMDEQKQLIRDFIAGFKQTQNRAPLVDEIVDHFKDTMDEDKLDTYVNMVLNERTNEAKTAVNRFSSVASALSGSLSSGLERPTFSAYNFSANPNDTQRALESFETSVNSTSGNIIQEANNINVVVKHGNDSD